MAADCAKELYRSKVAMVSLWPGAVNTEKIQATIEKVKDVPATDFSKVKLYCIF